MSKGKTLEESIRIQAYILSESAGHPSGMESFFWRQAEALVRGRAAAKLKTAKPKIKAKTKASPKAAKTAKVVKPAKPAKSTRKKKDPSPA